MLVISDPHHASVTGKFLKIFCCMLRLEGGVGGWEILRVAEDTHTKTDTQFLVFTHLNWSEWVFCCVLFSSRWEIDSRKDMFVHGSCFSFPCLTRGQGQLACSTATSLMRALCSAAKSEGTLSD